MGCSASRSSPPFQFTTTATDHQNPHSNSLNSSPFSDHHHFNNNNNTSSSTQTPVSRTMSLPTPLIHHPPLRKGDSNHFVSLTSTTYGSLTHPTPIPTDTTKTEEAPTVSSPDSVINTWELMEGLDDEYDIFHVNNNNNKTNPNKPYVSFGLDDGFDFFDDKNKTYMNKPYVSFGLGGPYELVEFSDVSEVSDIKPLWKHLSEESLLSKMDPSLVLSYNNAVSKKLAAHQVCSVPETLDLETLNNSKSLKSSKGVCCLPGCEDRIVLYYTSLRGIRKTYEDCCEIRLILKGFRVLVDERDVSMDACYRKELQGVFEGKGFTLPQVFIRGEHVGGADEIKRLHEEGKLFDYMKGFAVVDSGFVCDICGDVRFVPCMNCSGSKKVFEEEGGRPVRCPDCNENGLIRCVACCS